MKIGELIRQVADVVDAKEAQADKEQQLSQATQQAEVAAAIQSAQELQAGQVAQLTQAAQNVKQASTMNSNSTPELTTAPIEQPPTDQLTSVDQSDETDPSAMVPPLQQKHELLKKATGVENNTDEFANDLENDELSRMLRIAGIQPAPEQEVEINPKREAALLHFYTDNIEVE